MIFFTSDEHYGHKNIITYSNRPFLTVEDMDEQQIQRHNTFVGKDDHVIHAGDFTLLKNKPLIYGKYINRLNGSHTFLKGSHDYWIPWKNSQQIKEIQIQKKYYIVVCHYAMRTWARSHYNSFHLYGHSHGRLEPIGKQWDIGVDNNNFYPISLNDIIRIMKNRPDNPNLVKK